MCDGDYSPHARTHWHTYIYGDCKAYDVSMYLLGRWCASNGVSFSVLWSMLFTEYVIIASLLIQILMWQMHYPPPHSIRSIAFCCLITWLSWWLWWCAVPWLGCFPSCKVSNADSCTLCLQIFLKLSSVVCYIEHFEGRVWRENWVILEIPAIISLIHRILVCPVLIINYFE